MIFGITYTHVLDGRKHTLLMDSPDFETCLKNARLIFGDSIYKITYDPKRNVLEEKVCSR